MTLLSVQSWHLVIIVTWLACAYQSCDSKLAVSVVQQWHHKIIKLIRKDPVRATKEF